MCVLIHFWCIRRNAIQNCLPDIFLHLNEFLRGISGRMSANQLEERVVGVLRVWYDWTIFPTSYMYGLEAVFQQTESDISRFSKILPPDNDSSALERDIEGLRRKAKLAGISIAAPARSSSRDAVPEYYDGLTLYRKIMYVSDFTAIKEAALATDLLPLVSEEASAESNQEQSTIAPPIMGGSRGGRMNIVRRHQGGDASVADIEASPSDDEDGGIDGFPLQNSKYDEDVDGVPFDDDLDGVPFEDVEDRVDDCVDGIPFNDDIDGVPFEEE